LPTETTTVTIAVISCMRSRSGCLVFKIHMKRFALCKLWTIMTPTKMFDGWMDKYRARSYLAIRISVVKEWKVHIVTELWCSGCSQLGWHDSSCIHGAESFSWYH